MDKEIVTPQSLMDDAGTYYTNLIGSRSWKLESNKHAHIIALTTQLSELKTEIQSLSKNASDKSKGSAPESLLPLLKTMATSNPGVSLKSTTVPSSTWLKRVTRSTIGATSISIQDAIPKGCTYSINQLNTMHGKHVKTS
jgi:hypothetical protein